MNFTLPEPDDEMSARSQQLEREMAASIRQAGGWIPFDQWMNLALYTPGVGYYSTLSAVGEGGDFVTAPEISPLFSRVVARQILPTLSEVDSPEILEFGAGSGVMAAQILLELERQRQLPERYNILELSGGLRARQRETVERHAPHLLERICWLDQLPEHPLQGVVVANEVLDAIPFQRFVVRDGGAVAVGVSIDSQGGLVLMENPEPSVELPPDLEAERLAEGYLSEIRPGITPWISSISDLLERGTVLLLDYGYPRGEYYRPERQGGTLSCFYRHHQHEDPLWYPGLQDITAHVDFTAVAEAADASGLDVAVFTNQAYFLLGGGIAQLAEEEPLDDLQTRIETSRAIQQLTMPAQMGEVVKVMALTRGVELQQGFTLHDQRHTL